MLQLVGEMHKTSSQHVAATRGMQTLGIWELPFDFCRSWLHMIQLPPTPAIQNHSDPHLHAERRA